MNAIVSFEHPSNAPLPVVYTAAQKALAECYAIDECKAWADKAAALESYARQSDDETLLNLAKRIKGRAIRRCGQLLREIDRPEQGGRPPKNDDGGDTVSRKQAATNAGLSERQHHQALRIANIPEGSFNEQIDSETPPTLTELATQGTNKKPVPLFDLEGISPEDFQLATRVLGALHDLAKLAAHDPQRVLRGMKPQEKPEFCEDLTKVLTWLTKLEVGACTHTPT